MKQPTKPFQALHRGDLRKMITDKFKTVSRFCRLTGFENYGQVMAEITKHKDAELRLRIYLACVNESNIAQKGELTKEQKLEIKIAIMNYISDPRNSNLRLKTLKEFANHFGFGATWLSRLLSIEEYGAVRLNTEKVKSLLTILNLNYE